MKKCTSLVHLVRNGILLLLILSPLSIVEAKANSAPTPANLKSQKCIAKLSDSLKVGQLLLPIVPDPKTARAYAAQGLVTGVVVIGAVNKTQAASYQMLLAQPSPVPLLVASDEEGGTVQRYRLLLGSLPSARRLALTQTVDETRSTFEVYGKRLKKLGVSVALAPVADVGDGPGIGYRSFSRDAEVVGTYAQAVANGYLAAGVTPVYKHFPGHGRASADTHKSLALTPSLKELRKSDLKPFVALRDSNGIAVMVGHLSVPGLTKGAPATVSREAIDGLLRNEIGFDGVVFSDAFGMGAIVNYLPIQAATVRFIQAGGDVIILPTLADVARVHANLVLAVKKKEISDERLDDSVRRVLTMKGVEPCSITQLRKRD